MIDTQPSPEMLEGVAHAWRRDGRVIETAFGGDSMRPAIAPGTPVRVDCSREPQTGEVAMFRFDGRAGVHRVVRRTPRWLLTWGDANALPDAPLRHAQVIGTLQAVALQLPSRRRDALLALLAPRHASFEQVTRRIALAHTMHRGWRTGPRAFAALCLQKLARLAGIRSRSVA